MSLTPGKPRVSSPVPPDERALQEAALGYLDKSSCSIAQMTTLLGRRIKAWARRAEKAGIADEEITRASAVAEDAARVVIARLVSRRFLDDAAFAENRTERLTRAGKSRRAVAAYLAEKGVDENVARAATPHDDATELAAAITLLKKKRIGTFSLAAVDEENEKQRHRWLGMLARAGFSLETAERVLRMGREQAEEILLNR